jgi:hypothetical protein
LKIVENRGEPARVRTEDNSLKSSVSHPLSIGHAYIFVC